MRSIKDILDHVSIDKIDAELILLHAIGQGSKVFLFTHDDYILSQAEYGLYLELCKKRQHGKPIAYIIGYKYFWGSKFIVNESTLIPRPESELLIENILKFFPDRSNHITAADFGSGSGALGLSFLNEYINSKCYLIDKSAKALRCSRLNGNATYTNVQNRAIYFKGSWSEFSLLKKLDLIISNPPYISQKGRANIMRGVSFYEPHSALFDYIDNKGVSAYMQIIDIADKILKKGGYLFFEVDENWRHIKWDKNKFYKIDLVNDLYRTPRCLILKKLF